MKKLSLVLLVALAVAFSAVLGLVGCGKGAPTEVILATTSSTQDSGLLDVLLPEFEKQYNHTVKTIAVGSGEAMEMGKQGNADVLLVHAKASEEEFVAAGYGLQRVEVMYNDFIILGPSADAAGIKGEKSAVEAFKKIAAAGDADKAVFVSRADDSGTNKAELKIWKEAGIDPVGKPWYIGTGQGMGETLAIADEKQGYTLTDRATYIAREGNKLVVLVEGDKALYNQYSVIVVNPEKHPGKDLNVTGAGDFCEFMTSEQGQKMIDDYRLQGKQLFYPNAKEETRGMGDYKE